MCENGATLNYGEGERFLSCFKTKIESTQVASHPSVIFYCSVQFSTHFSLLSCHQHVPHKNCIFRHKRLFIDIIFLSTEKWEERAMGIDAEKNGVRETLLNLFYVRAKLTKQKYTTRLNQPENVFFDHADSRVWISVPMAEDERKLCKPQHRKSSLWRFQHFF